MRNRIIELTAGKNRFSSVFFAMTLLTLLTCAVYAQQPGDYKLGSEDVIIVTTIGKPEFSGEYIIPQDGAVNIPGVGLITATGKTVVDLSKEIEGILAKRLQRPEVYVTLKSQKEPLVFVLGVAGKSAPVAFKPGWRLTELLSASGGAGGNEPADITVTMYRSGAPKQVFAYSDIIANLEGKNPAIQSGDVVVVEKVEQFQVYVAGKVRSPGVFPIRKDNCNLLNVLAMAGGATEDGAVTRVTVTHLNGESETIDLSPFLENGKLESAPKVSQGDLVVVPESRKRIAVMGWVKAPSFYPMRDNEKLTLSEALSMAGGVELRRGGAGKVAVLRTTNGKQERMVFDYRKFIAKGDATQNPEILAGDIIWVPETDAIDWDRWIGRLSTGLGTWYTIDRLINNRND